MAVELLIVTRVDDLRESGINSVQLSNSLAEKDGAMSLDGHLNGTKRKS